MSESSSLFFPTDMFSMWPIFIGENSESKKLSHVRLILLTFGSTHLWKQVLHLEMRTNGELELPAKQIVHVCEWVSDTPISAIHKGSSYKGYYTSFAS